MGFLVKLRGLSGEDFLVLVFNRAMSANLEGDGIRSTIRP